MSVLPAGVRVEINFEGASGGTALIFGDATRGTFGTGTFGGAPEFVDVAGRVRAGTITRGASRFEGVYARAEAGTAEVVLDNRDAAFDPTYLAGPYVAAGASQVQPMRAWRIRASMGGGTTFELWRGFADSWESSYPAGGHDAVTVLRGTDGAKVLANFDPPETAGAVEDSGARVNRILDLADWPAADRVVQAGVSILQADPISSALWTELLLTADSEIGEIYVDGAGRVVYRNRYAILTETRSAVSNGVFGDGPGELPVLEVVTSFDESRLANVIRVARVGGSEQVAEDAVSQATYLPRTWERSDLLLSTEEEVAEYAAYVLALLKDPELRFERVSVDPRRDPETLYPQVLGRELGDRITVRIRPPGREADPLERECIIRGIAHDFGPERWVTTWTLQDTATLVFGVVGTAVVDTAVVGY
jgi:hypothetical protein